MAVAASGMEARCLGSLPRLVELREAQTLSQHYSESTPSVLLLSVDLYLRDSPTWPIR